MCPFTRPRSAIYNVMHEGKKHCRNRRRRYYNLDHKGEEKTTQLSKQQAHVFLENYVMYVLIDLCISSF